MKSRMKRLSFVLVTLTIIMATIFMLTNNVHQTPFQLNWSYYNLKDSFLRKENHIENHKEIIKKIHTEDLKSEHLMTEGGQVNLTSKEHSAAKGSSGSPLVYLEPKGTHLSVVNISVLGTASLPRSIENFTHYTIITCKDESVKRQKREQWNHQLRQISVLLKSAAVLTKTGIQFDVVANSQGAYEDVLSLTKEWPPEYQKRLGFRRREVYYPEKLKSIEDMFCRCCTERLFLKDVLKEMDSTIFVDTDTLFMQPPEDLWDYFGYFDHRQVIGVTPCMYMYNEGYRGSKKGFGFSGLNAGVLLMNLTRIRSFPTEWDTTITKILQDHKNHITLADQDILNILFSGKGSKYAFEVGCEWNYRLKLCSLDRNRCPNAAVKGVSLLHGTAMTFVNAEGPKIKAIFEAWEKHNLSSPETELVSLLEEGLKRTNKAKKGCYKVPNIDHILLKGLKRSLSILEQ